jgi:hypothetical protein
VCPFAQGIVDSFLRCYEDTDLLSRVYDVLNFEHKVLSESSTPPKIEHMFAYLGRLKFLTTLTLMSYRGLESVEARQHMLFRLEDLIAKILLLWHEEPAVYPEVLRFLAAYFVEKQETLTQFAVAQDLADAAQRAADRSQLPQPPRAESLLSLPTPGSPLSRPSSRLSTRNSSLDSLLHSFEDI